MGGSESRFLLHPYNIESYITQIDKTLGRDTGFAERAENNRYQKIVCKQQPGNFLSLQFDNHPQHYLAYEDGAVRMLQSFSAGARWKMISVGVRRFCINDGIIQRGEIERVPINLGWSFMQSRSALVHIYNVSARRVLSYRDGQFILADDDYQALCWEMDCVDHNLSANEVQDSIFTWGVATIAVVNAGVKIAYAEGIFAVVREAAVNFNGAYTAVTNLANWRENIRAGAEAAVAVFDEDGVVAGGAGADEAIAFAPIMSANLLMQIFAYM